MARNRAWRRAQRSRIIQRRRQIGVSFGDSSAEWTEKWYHRWGKTNPWTACSCMGCRNYLWLPEVDWRTDWE